MISRHVLLLVPHPDDEVVACAAAIRRAKLATNVCFYCLYLTHGCIARETLWPWQRFSYAQRVARRKAEAECAAQYLGVEVLNWTERPARHLWRELDAVYREIKQAIAQYGIDELWAPAYEGGNADHDALNAVASRFSKTLAVLEFAEYNFKDRRTQSQIFPDPNGTEIFLTLDAEEQAFKSKALGLYVSEKSNLNYVSTTREAYRPIAPHDYARPPHEGMLWYTRFQWVPFRHPRVDFTNPSDVSNAITKFLREH